ncbi:MAG: histidinol-phosphate transaminase [Planctomycetota bacterium]
MNLFRDNVERMAGYTPGEQPQDKKYVKLNTNECPYPASPKVFEAIKAAANPDLRLYPDPMAARFRVKLAEVYGFSPGEIIAGQGGDDILNLIVRACAARGDVVASLYPSYTLYDTLAELQEAEFVRVDKVEELTGTGAKVNFVCNPNAPTGEWTEMDALAALAPKLGGLLVVDEAYADFAEDTCLPLVRRHANVIVVRTMSKSFSLAGMRLGYGIAQAPVIEQLFKVKESYNLDRISLAAAEAALDDLEHVEANVRRVIATRERLKGALRGMGLFFYPSRSNFVFLRIDNARAVKQELMARGVLVRHFDTPDLKEFIRVTVGSDEEIDRFLTELKGIV